MYSWPGRDRGEGGGPWYDDIGSHFLGSIVAHCLSVYAATESYVYVWTYF